MVKESKHYSEQLAGVMWKDKPDLKKDINSNIRFYPLDHWIVPKLCDLANTVNDEHYNCLLYTSPSPRDRQKSRMPSSA